MNGTENPISFLRTLKGAPAMIMFALAIAGRAMSNAELQLWTGYADENITQALRLLVAMGWVIAKKSKGPWSLAKDVPLQWITSEGSESDKIGDPSSSSSILNNDSVNEEDKEDEEEQTPINSEMHDFLLANGIYEPAATELAGLPHITQEYVRDHIAWAESKDFDMGTAIDRMRKRWQVPKKFKNPPDDTEDRHKYIRGKYADFVSH